MDVGYEGDCFRRLLIRGRRGKEVFVVIVVRVRVFGGLLGERDVERAVEVEVEDLAGVGPGVVVHGVD